MTEEEAKTKWCPFAMFADAAWGPHNRATKHDKAVTDGVLCIGSGCMAWRWGDSDIGAYCGLAGKP